LHKISITHYFFTFIFLFILVLILSFSFPHKHSERYLLLLAFVLILGNAVYYLSNKKIFSLSYFFTSLIVIFPILRIKLRVKIFFILLLIYFYYKNKKDFYCKITIQSRSTIICSICSSFNLGEVLCLFLGLSWLAEVLGACWQSLPCVGGPTPPPTSPPIMPAPPIELQPAQATPSVIEDRKKLITQLKALENIGIKVNLREIEQLKVGVIEETAEGHT